MNAATVRLLEQAAEDAPDFTADTFIPRCADDRPDPDHWYCDPMTCTEAADRIAYAAMNDDRYCYSCDGACEFDGC